MSSPQAPGDQAWPPDLEDAFWAYEQALADDDVDALDELFAPGPATLRGDAAGLLVGHTAIGAFRRARGGAPQRTVTRVEVRPAGPDHALVLAVTELVRGGSGLQTQLWAADDTARHGWRIVGAHVSQTAPALDTRVWRVVGAPLVSGADEGRLAGARVAVKDLYDIAGQRVGAGNPTYLSAAPPANRTARVVQRLLDAGAEVTGIARTDEFAWSLFGENAHHGTPPNPRAPGRLPGGSSSGSASAVALGHADIGLGTDTGGSIRVPASWQGLWGIRTSRGAVPRDGLLALAPTFDAVGWMTREADLLVEVGDVLLPPAPPSEAAELVLATDLLAMADADVAAAIDAFARRWGTVLREPLGIDDLPHWRRTFSTVQAAEAWRQHAGWLASRADTLGADVRGRFATAAQLRPDEVHDAVRSLETLRVEARHRVGDRVLLLPSTPSAAPLPGTADQPLREAMLELTCLAGIGGMPAISVPLRTAEGLPCGVCLVGAPGRDRQLLALARSMADAAAT